MRIRGLLVLFVALVAGLAAVVWLRGLNRTQAAGTQLPSIVVAATSLNFGDRIRTIDIKLVKWPAENVPEGAFKSIQDLAGPNQDRVVLRPMEPNEPVLESKVSGIGGKASLSTTINPKMRAVTIRVNDATGVAGFITPGDHVDILLTHLDGPPNMNAPNMSAKIDMILQDVLVRGIDQEANEKKDKPTVVKAVTVEVSPEDAAKLTLASSIGTLSLSLRNFGSSQEDSIRSLSVGDLLPNARAARIAPMPPVEPTAAKPPAQSRSYDIVRGVVATTYVLQHSENGTEP